MSLVIADVGEGDSLTFTLFSYLYTALGIDNTSWPSDQGAGIAIRKWARWRNASPALQLANFALSGSRLGDLAARATALDALVSPDANRRYILSLLIGTNPEGAANPTTFAADVATYCLARRAAGWHAIILGTLPSRTDGVIANFDTAYAQPYNTIIKGAGWKESAGVTAIADYAADSEIGATNAANNGTYFNADHIHPITAGQALMGARKLTALNAVLAGF